MKLFQYIIGSLVKKALFFLVILFSILLNTAQAQFTITENFKGQVGADIIVGEHASLTSGVDDPIGAGWLRLTPGGIENRRGYAYVNRTFPSTLGVIIDFEYKLWRKLNNNEFTAGDGFSIFLFDGQYGPSNFKPGGYGGALIYAPLVGGTPWDIPGLSGGYIGLGFDSFGNYGNEVEGRFGSIEPDATNGSASSYRPNSIILRGPTTTNRESKIENGIQPTNRFLGGKKLGTRYADANNTRNQTEVHYFPLTQKRPTDTEFYRRVQIEIRPVVSGKSYRIIARWAKSRTGPFVELFNSVTNDVPPELLKMGFGAATGGARQYHEIRNLLVTTPGNLRLTKRADKDILRRVDLGREDNLVSYTIEVVNDTESPLRNISFVDSLTDINGKIVDKETFEILSIKDQGFISAELKEDVDKVSNKKVNKIIGSLNLAASSTGIITVTGELKKIPAGNLLVNTANVMPTDITDEDLGNNTSVVQIPVIAEKVDVTLENISPLVCLDGVNGNNFELQVGNVGSEPVEKKNRVVVVKEIPQGTKFLQNPSDYDGWEREKISENKYQYTAKVDIESGRIYAKTIKYKLTPINNTTTYTDASEVFYYRGSTGSNGVNTIIEPPENRGNNKSSITMRPLPKKPDVVGKVYYCVGEVAEQLSAKGDEGNRLLWYLNKGGAAATVAYTPNTSVVGTTTYYVTQSNGICESISAQIDVIVLSPPTAGTISGNQEACAGTALGTISSKQNATIPNWPGTTVLTYRWEKLAPIAGSSWATIQGANAENYTPGAENIVGVWKYRRVAIPVLAGKESACRPEAISNEVSVTVKNCLIISNPMLRSRARK